MDSPVTDVSRSSRIETALILGLGCGAIDAATALLDKPSGFAFWISIAPTFVATALTIGISFLVLAAVVSIVARIAGIGEKPALIASAVFVGTLFSSAAFSDMLRAPQGPIELFRWLLVASAAMIIAAGSYVAVVAISATSHSGRLAGLARGAPFVLVLVVAFEWVQVYISESPLSAVSVLSALALVLGSSAVAYGFSRDHFPAGKALWGLMSGLVVVTFAAGAAGGQRVDSGAPVKSAATGRDPRHVILITVDTLRSDRLSCYSGERGVPTPAIDALADDGILFEQPTSSAPWTLGSLSSILTGLSPSVHSVNDIDSRLPDSVTTLAENLKRVGYHTGAVVLNDLLHPRSNLKQGFDDYHFLTFQAYGRSFGRRVLETVLPARFPEPAWPTTDDVTDSAEAWLAANEDRDFFLWVHYYDPHAPFEPPSRYLPDEIPLGMGRTFAGQKAVLSGLEIPGGAQRTWIEALYSAEVKYLDDNVGRLVETLRAHDIYDDALIVFTSDHGEEFWEHGAHGHGHSLYDELLAVPLIVKLPGSTAHGRVHTRVATESISPTVLELCGVDYDARRYTSQSLAPWLSPDGAGDARAIVSTSQVLFDRQETVYIDGFKYIRSLVGDQEELFDLREDPGERRPLALDNDEIIARARRQLEDHEAYSRQLRERFDIDGLESVEFDSETIEKLRALGYIQ